MKMNEDKSHLLFIGTQDDEVTINIGWSLAKENDKEKLIGVTLIKKLNFNNYVSEICKNVSQSYMHWNDC